MTTTITIETNIATEYTNLNENLSKYAMIIRKRISSYTDENLTPSSKSLVTIEIDKSPVQKIFIKDLQEIEDLKLNITEKLSKF